jgi:hypothetical protein
MKPFAVGLAFALACAATSALAATPDNTLTRAEKKAGWVLLFDGKDTKGWRGFKADAPDAGWTVKDGVIGPDPKTSKDIISQGEYANFELTFDWRISPQGNSGVMYHVVEQGDETYQSGPEYQILDNAHPTPAVEKAASLFALYAPSKDMTKAPGDFNHGRIVVDHGRVEHWLNGVKVVEYDLNSAEFKAKVAASKFRQWPQFAASPTGHIALQCHGDAVGFRNIKIRVIR